MLRVVASGLGIVGATVLFIQLILGSRFITALFTKDLINTNSRHQLWGKTGVLLVLLHPVLMTLAYRETWSFIIIPSDATRFSFYTSLGRLALVFLSIILVTSVWLRKKLHYRLWRKIHLLAYPIIALVLWHALAIGSQLASVPLLTGYWYGLIVAYTLLVSVRILLWSGLGTPRYVLKQKKQLTPVIYEYRFSPTGSKLIPLPGQFVYIQKNRFGAAHPFTVMDYKDQSGELVFAVKAHGLFTRSLTKMPEGTDVFIDGPYGVFTREAHNQKPKVFIAGGIGITPFIRTIREHGSPETYLFYTNRNPTHAIYDNELKMNLGERYMNANSSRKRLDAQTVMAGLPEKIWKQANFFICGPESMNFSLSHGLKNLGVVKERIFVEKFSL